jgi:hypothetical protein
LKNIHWPERKKLIKIIAVAVDEDGLKNHKDRKNDYRYDNMKRYFSMLDQVQNDHRRYQNKTDGFRPKGKIHENAYQKGVEDTYF